jgi:predicted permease
MHAMLRDLRFGFRSLAKQPGFAVMAILALGLGIGSATTIFSVIQNVLLDPFPYTDASKVVSPQIRDTSSSRPGGRYFFQTAEFLDLVEQSHVFEQVIGGTGEDVLWDNGEGTQQLNGGIVTANTFQFLGVPAMAGRGIQPEDAKPGAPPVFVMSHKMWMKHFAPDLKVLGRSFILNGAPTTLVGVMPKRFTKLGADLWRPVSLDRANPELTRQYFMFQATLKPGVTIQQAEADVNIVLRRLATVYPDNYPKNFAVKVVSWLESLVGGFRPILYTLAAAVGLLLLISCANVANMLLARATVREKEMAVRAALGASRGRLVRQMLVEGFLLSLGGAILGSVFAYGGVQALVALIPDGSIPREAEIRLNLPVLGFSLAMAVVTALVFGLIPAFQAARRDIAEPLKDTGKGVSGGFRKGRLRNALVVVEVALSMVLLVGAGLMMRSFFKLQSVDLGFDPNNILVARIPFPKGQYKTAASKQQFFRQLLPRLQALPGVTAAAETTSLPPYGGVRSDIDIPGKTHSDRWDAIYNLCSEGYARTIGYKLLRGRSLSEVDVNDARKVAVVNQTFARKYLPNEDAVGQRVKISGMERLPGSPVANPVFEIIGVVSDVRNQGLEEPTRPEIHVPYTLTGAFERGVLLRTAGDPLPLLNSLRREIWAVDRNVAMTFADSLNHWLNEFSYSGPRFGLVLMSIFAGVGLVLVAIGVYSVVAYTVSRQTHEIGIRMALGAGGGDVLGMVLRMGMRLLAVGIGAGLLISLAASRVLNSQIRNISTTDPVTIALVIAVVVGAGVAACYFPARRATRVDPLVALRYE